MLQPLEVGRVDDASLHTRKCNYAVIHDVQCMNGVGSSEKAPGNGASVRVCGMHVPWQEQRKALGAPAPASSSRMRAPPLIAAHTGESTWQSSVLKSSHALRPRIALTNCGSFVMTMSTSIVYVYMIKRVFIKSYKHALLSHFSSMSPR